MSVILDKDDFPHLDYPRQSEFPWKENWYFNFFDQENGAWGFNHISFQRHLNKAQFIAFHFVDGKLLRYVNIIDLPEDNAELTDGNFRVEILEPHKKYRLSFDGPKHAIDLTYESRFPLFNYDKNKQTGSFDNKETLSIIHYEQGLTVNGTLKTGGKTRPISCLGHRDHTWGYRNEDNVQGWNWVAAQFPSQTINLTRTSIQGEEPAQAGFISTASGNISIDRVEVILVERDEKGAPRLTVYKFTDENNRSQILTAKRQSHVAIPMNKQGANVHEVFAEFTLNDMDEVGYGLDEHLVNPGV